MTYLLHREVIRNDKSSTKVRAVYDGGVNRKNKVSLNEALQKGPALNTNMYELLLKFRIYPIAITADIEKAYLQIEVDKKHRNFLRFLWYLDMFAEEPEIVKFRFCRVTVRKHGEKYEAIDPEFTRMVTKHFYIDDLPTGAENVKKGHEIYKKTKIRFIEAQFNVKKWRTNSAELRNMIPNEDLLKE